MILKGTLDRTAYIFHGITIPGDSGDMAAFPANAEWYLWVATTFDGGATWELRNATPNNPTQKGSICDQGVGCDNTPNDRNLLDFMDADIDGEGRILVGYADGCVDACVTGGPNSFSRRGYIARQATGKRMLAQFDPPEPSNLPGSPALTASRDPPGFESYKVAAGSNGARRGDFVEGMPKPARQRGPVRLRLRGWNSSRGHHQPDHRASVRSGRPSTGRRCACRIRAARPAPRRPSSRSARSA